MMLNKTTGLISIAVLLPILVWMLFFWSPLEKQPLKHEMLNIAATPRGGDFVVDIKDSTLALADLRDKVVVLYFGYTLCPDICPTSLALLSNALQQMNEEELAALQSIFISVDPERDNETRLDEYTKYFHPNIIGATANEKEIKRITGLYGAAYRKVESKSAVGYMVDHSSFTYLIDRKGKLRFSLEHGTSPTVILSRIRELLSES